MAQKRLTRRERARQVLVILKRWFKAHRDAYVPTLRDPFKMLIATVISARTKDETTSVVSERLFSKFPDAKSLARADPGEVARLIYPAGFYKTKAPRLVEIAKIILNKYDGKVPETLDELVKLPGVGRKTANIVLAYALGKPAIAVDVHVHRIANRLGLVKTKTPRETEEELMNLYPKKDWISINQILVSFGRQVCKPVKPKCSECPLRDLCPFPKKLV